MVLDSPEIQAKLDQAEAARQAASAQRDKAYNGAREEEIRQARSAWERAQHATELAEKTFRRIDRLNKDGVVPAQRRDEAEAMLKTSRDAESVARAAYDMATTGARDEDKEAATALVTRASGAIAEVNAYLGETRLVAPLAGRGLQAQRRAGRDRRGGLPDPDAAGSDRRLGDVPGPGGQARRRADGLPRCRAHSRPSRTAAPS